MKKQHEISIKTPYIKLGAFLKLAGIISQGSEAKYFLEAKRVFVNQEIDTHRGRKLFIGDLIEIDDKEYIIKVKIEDKSYGK